jgi:hypothetical protein
MADSAERPSIWRDRLIGTAGILAILCIYNWLLLPLHDRHVWSLPQKMVGMLICLFTPFIRFFPDIISFFRMEDRISKHGDDYHVGRGITIGVFFPIVLRIFVNIDKYLSNPGILLGYIMVGTFVLLEAATRIGAHAVCLINGIDTWGVSDIDDRISLLIRRKGEAFPDGRTTILVFSVLILVLVVPLICLAPLIVGEFALALLFVIFTFIVTVFDRCFYLYAFGRLISSAEMIGEMIRKERTDELRKLKLRYERWVFWVKMSFAAVLAIVVLTFLTAYF